MAFNLYFAGSQCKEADELMVKLNCNRLFSQENDRKIYQIGRIISIVEEPSIKGIFLFILVLFLCIQKVLN